MKNYCKSWLIQLSNKFHFISIFIILVCLSYYNIYNIILLFIYILYLYKIKLINKLLLSIFIISTIYISVDYISYKYRNVNIDNVFIVIDIKDNRYLVRDGIYKYYLYSKNNYNVGDILEIKGKVKDIKKPSYEGDYNLELNLFSKYICGYIEYNSIKLKGHKFSLYEIRYNILEFYKCKILPETYKYFSALTLAYNNLDKDAFIKLNLAHIIAISGFHIVLIYNFIKKSLFRITHNLYNSDIIALSIVIIYNVLTGFSISVLKATIYLLIKRENDKYDYLTTLDILSLTFILMMLRSRLIFNIGFILGFLSSFILIYINEIITTNNKFMKSILNGILIFLFLLPFISKMNNQVSILAIFSFFLFDFFAKILIPMSFILFLIPSISVLLEPTINIFNTLLSNTSNILLINFPTMPTFLIYIYYPILYILFIYNKYIIKILLSLTLILIIYFNTIITIDRVEFIDVNQGDATYILDSGFNILIDSHNCYNYLVRKGIYKLDYIFITHDDLDHLSDLDDILKNLSVDTVYTNPYSKVVVDLCNKNNVNLKFISCGDTFKIGNSKIEVLSPSYDHKDDNMNSLVLKYINNYYSYLFTGDISILNEKELINNNIGRFDILKVAHHGSNTSSSIEFLKYIKPIISIVSVGDNNYGLPNDKVINTLNLISKVYITKINGNIKVIKDKIIAYK